MKITKRFQFSASHYLCNPALSAAENRKIFGACYGLHGHNFTLDVTVEGRVNPRTGMVINFHELKAIVQEQVLDRYDHRDFRDLPEFKGRVQTAEALSHIIWKRLAGRFPKGVRLSTIRLAETPDNWVEFNGK